MPVLPRAALAGPAAPSSPPCSRVAVGSTLGLPAALGRGHRRRDAGRRCRGTGAAPHGRGCPPARSRGRRPARRDRPHRRASGPDAALAGRKWPVVGPGGGCLVARPATSSGPSCSCPWLAPTRVSHPAAGSSMPGFHGTRRSYPVTGCRCGARWKRRQTMPRASPASSPGGAPWARSRQTPFERLAAGPGAMAAVERLRRAIDEAIGRAIPEPEAGLASGILDRPARARGARGRRTTSPRPASPTWWPSAAGTSRSWPASSRGCCARPGLRRRARSLVVLVAIGGLHDRGGRRGQRRPSRASWAAWCSWRARVGVRPARRRRWASPARVCCWPIRAWWTTSACSSRWQRRPGCWPWAVPAEAAVRRLTPTGTPGWLRGDAGRLAGRPAGHAAAHPAATSAGSRSSRRWRTC